MGKATRRALSLTHDRDAPIKPISVPRPPAGRRAPPGQWALLAGTGRDPDRTHASGAAARSSARRLPNPRNTPVLTPE